MGNAQVAVAEYCPDWRPATTRLLVRRVLLDPAQVSADPRSRRRRTLHPDQRALPFPELAGAGAIYAYSFIVTSLDVTAPGKAAAVEHWYRHRTTAENIFRDSVRTRLYHRWHERHRRNSGLHQPWSRPSACGTKRATASAP